MGRSFVSPPGVGVYLSVILRPEAPPEELMHLTCAVAEVLCDGIEVASGLRPGIKWTNDVILKGKKLCGILTEMSLEGETGQIEYVIVGIGINVSQTPEDFSPEVAQMATSCLQAVGHPVSRTALAAALIRELDRLRLQLGGDGADYLAAYRKDCVNLGKPVQLLWREESRQATAVDIDPQFGLVVRYEDGSLETIRSGEVSVRGLYGYLS